MGNFKQLLVIVETCLILLCHQVRGLQLQDVIETPTTPMKEFRQHNNILKFSVEENKPPNTFVAQICSADQQIPHMILPWPSKTTEREIRQAFSYNSTNGELYTLTSLDREHRDHYYFVAITKEPFAEIKCSVEILDVNDNAPRFQTPNSNDTHIVIDMPEGQSGFRHKLPMAYDYDSAQYGIKEFRITSGNTPSGTFLLVESGAPTHSTSIGLDDQSSSMLASDNPQLRKQLDQESNVLVPSQSTQQSSGPTTATTTPQQSSAPATKSFYIDLEANVPLDRENQSSYTLQVEAIDGGSPAMFGRLVVTVNVIDINDNDPVFLAKSINNPYEISLPENTTKGSLIYTVKAYDVDLGPNGQVNYSIKRVIPSSQQIANSTSSDYTNTNSNNNNNEMPTNRSPSSAMKPRGQQSQQNKFVPTGNQRTRSQQEQPLFEMDAKKGEIYLAGQLDYEQDYMYELIVEVRDNGKPQRNSTASIRVYVIDTKDEPFSNARGTEDGKRQTNQTNLVTLAQPQISVDPHHAGFMEMFVVVFAALIAIGFIFCLVKMKSRQPESDYNDTAGLMPPLPQVGQIPPTSASHLTSGNVFAYPPSRGPGSILECYPDGNHNTLHSTGRLSDTAGLMPPLHQVGQIQPRSASHLTSGNVFSYPPSHGPGSILGCYPDVNHHHHGSTMDSCSSGTGGGAPTPPPLDRWLDLGVPAQLINTQDWCGTYNWDDLEEWTPEYTTVLMGLKSGLFL